MRNCLYTFKRKELLGRKLVDLGQGKVGRGTTFDHEQKLGQLEQEKHPQIMPMNTSTINLSSYIHNIRF